MSNNLLLRRRAIMKDTGVRPDYFRITPTSACTVSPGLVPYASPYGPSIINRPNLESDFLDYLIENYLDWDIEYSISGGSFHKVTLWEPITLQNGEYIEFRRNPSSEIMTSLVKPTYFEVEYNGETHYANFGNEGLITFRPDVPYYVSGNIMSLLDASCNSKSVGAKAFASFFREDSNIIAFNGIIEISEVSGKYSFSEMFSRCTSLVKAPIFRIGSSEYDYIYQKMFYDCSVSETYDFLDLKDDNVFRNNTSAKSLIIRSIIPPIIKNSTITGLAADCAIYVPAGSVDAYKAAQYWSARAAYIQAIPG